MLHWLNWVDKRYECSFELTKSSVLQFSNVYRKIKKDFLVRFL